MLNLFIVSMTKWYYFNIILNVIESLLEHKPDMSGHIRFVLQLPAPTRAQLLYLRTYHFCALNIVALLDIHAF